MGTGSLQCSTTVVEGKWPEARCRWFPLNWAVTISAPLGQTVCFARVTECATRHEGSVSVNNTYRSASGERTVAPVRRCSTTARCARFPAPLVSMVPFAPEMGLARMGSAGAAFRGLGPLAAIRVTVRMVPARVTALVTRQQALAIAVRTTLVVAVRTADLG